VLETLEGTGQITPKSGDDALAHLDDTKIHALTGPVYVEARSWVTRSSSPSSPSGTAAGAGAELFPALGFSRASSRSPTSTITGSNVDLPVALGCVAVPASETPVEVTLSFELVKGETVSEIRFLTPAGRPLIAAGVDGYFATTAHGPDLFEGPSAPFAS
jgi:hypothetical protein